MADEINNMTVRQEYKKAAMSGLLSDAVTIAAMEILSEREGTEMAFIVSIAAGEYADAMLAEDAAHDAKVKP